MKTVINILDAEDRAKELFPDCDALSITQAVEFTKVLIKRDWLSKHQAKAVTDLFEGRSNAGKSRTKTPHEIVDALNGLRPDPEADFYPHDGNGYSLEMYLGRSDRHVTFAGQAVRRTDREYNG
ncbi:MAG: hypothetical protein WC004_01905 [Candidatus Absconditabacterales bacterium]